MSVNFPQTLLQPIYDMLNQLLNQLFSYGSDVFFFAIIPYVAILIGLYGIWHRMRNHQFSQSSQSSQFLNRGYSLSQALNFFHYGLIIVLGIHFLLVVFTLVWPNDVNYFFNNNPDLVMYLEIFLWSITLLIIFGVVALITRRLLNTRAQTVTTKLDWLLISLIFIQVTLGFLIATGYYPGMQWYVASIVPWFVSLATLSPNVATIGAFDGLIKLHAINGFFIFAVIPFTRLIHFISFPYGYLFRKYQIAVWYSRRKSPDS